MHAVLNTASIGHLYVGTIYRLAAELADLAVADHRRRRTESGLGRHRTETSAAVTGHTGESDEEVDRT